MHITKVDNGFVVKMPVIQEQKQKLGERIPMKFNTTLICKDVKEVNELVKKFSETDYSRNDEGMYSLAHAEGI